MRALTVLCLLLWLGPASAQVEEAIDELLAPDAAPADADGTEAGGTIDSERSPERDAEIAARLRAIYAELEPLAGVEVEVAEGVVTLGGTAASARAAERAVEIATQVAGVVEVLDESVVDTSLARRLGATLERLETGLLALLAALPLFLLALAVVVLFWWLGRRLARRRAFFRRLAPNAFIAELLAGIARIFVVLVGLFLALSLLDATSVIGTVLGAAGIIGLAVGFAVRDTVENYIASILLSLRAPFVARDYVAIGEHEGHVARLTSRATILISLDGNHIRIPNAFVYKSTIVNYTRNPERRFSFTVGVDTGLDLKAAQQTALDALHRVPGVLREPAASVIVHELGDSNVALEAMAWVDQNRNDLLRVRSEAIRYVKQAFDDAGIAMPEPIYRINLDTAGGPAPELVGTVFADAGGEPAAGARDGAATDPAAAVATGAAAGRRTRESDVPQDVARRPSGEDAGDTSIDTATHATLERELGHAAAENLLADEVPPE